MTGTNIGEAKPSCSRLQPFPAHRTSPHHPAGSRPHVAAAESSQRSPSPERLTEPSGALPSTPPPLQPRTGTSPLSRPEAPQGWSHNWGLGCRLQAGAGQRVGCIWVGTLGWGPKSCIAACLREAPVWDECGDRWGLAYGRYWGVGRTRGLGGRLQCRARGSRWEPEGNSCQDPGGVMVSSD